jgi:hypothetical protein
MTRVAFRRLPAVAAAMGGGPAAIAAAAWISPIAAAALAGGTLVATVIILWPITGLLLSAAVVPLERIGRLTDDSSTYTFSLMRAIGVVTLAGVALHFALGRRRLQIPTPLLLYGTYVGLGLLTLSHTSDWTYGLRAGSAMLGNVLFLFVTVNLLRTSRHATWAVALWLITTTAIGAFTIYQWHNPAATVSEDRFNTTGERTQDERFATVLYDTSEYQVVDKTPRALGSTSHPAVYGINVILALPFYAYVLRLARAFWLRAGILLAGLVACYNAVLTNTRAVIVTLGVTLMLIGVTGLVRVRVRLLGLGLVAAVAMFPLIPSALYDRVFDPQNYRLGRSETMRARLTYWTEGLNILEENWLLGMGIGNQTELPRRLRKRMDMPDNSTVHNEYLQSLLESGLIGYPWLVAFIAALWLRCRRGARMLSALGRTDDAWLLQACFVALLSMLFFGTQVDVLHFPLKGWWLAMGIATVLSDQARRAWRARASEEAAA